GRRRSRRRLARLRSPRARSRATRRHGDLTHHQQHRQPGGHRFADQENPHRPDADRQGRHHHHHGLRRQDRRPPRRRGRPDAILHERRKTTGPPSLLHPLRQTPRPHRPRRRHPPDHLHLPALAHHHQGDRKSTRLNSSHVKSSYAVF